MFSKRAFLSLLLFLPIMLQAARGEEPAMLDSLLYRFNVYSTRCSPEKVFLHYDRSCFVAGETIWFKGWVREASSLSQLPPSNFLYAEILDDRGEAVVRVKIKRTGNGFPGCIELPDNLETGDYTLRAYTLWQLNGDSGYLFNDRIRIIGGNKRAEKAPGEPSSEVDISFWPEGGRYFAGQKAAVGFKVTDGQGRSVDFSGTLVTDSGEEIRRDISTRHDGMGVFFFFPEPGSRYSILDASGKRHPLPPPAEAGATLQLRTHEDRYYIRAIGYGSGVSSLLVRNDSWIIPLGQLSLDGKEGSLIIEKKGFRPGINHLLLVNERGKILAERLFYVRDRKAPDCKLDMTRFEAGPRASVSGSISLNSPDGTPLDGECSVSVVRGALKDWQQSDGITSYMGLSSELKGKINQPYYYFDPDIPEEERDAALDALMMIQGWRYYDLEQIADTGGGNFHIRYLRERIQELRGHIARRISSKMPKNFTFTFMIPRRNFVHSIEVDQGRKFIVDSLDFPENTEFLINIQTSRLGATYLPKWDGDPVAEPYRYSPAPGFSRATRLEPPLQNDWAADDSLQAAVVTASYSDNDVLVFGRNYREDLETYREMTLVEYLSMKKAVFEYDGENMFNRSRRRSVSSDTDSFDDAPILEDENDSGSVKLIVDDMEEVWWAFDMVRLEDLRSLSISTQPDPVYGGDGGVVHIALKPGVSLRSAERNPSLLYFVPLGYQTPRYFTAPRYDLGEHGPYDQRNTIWWSPDVTISGGRAAISFCNSDQMDYPYIIRIEGISAGGRPFSRHCIVNP